MGFDYGDHDKAWNDGDWFNKLGGRCQFTGRPVGHANGRYHPWARHHTSRKARRLPLTVLWKYPNVLQRCFHGWCRLPHRMKLVITWLMESSILILFCWASYFFYELYRDYGITPAQFVVEFFRFW